MASFDIYEEAKDIILPLENLINSQEWKKFVRYLQNEHGDCINFLVNGSKEIVDVQYARGRINMIRDILSLQTTIDELKNNK